MTRRANGEHTIFHRKDGRWAGGAYVLTNTGGRKRVWVYGKTRAEAKDKLDRLLREVDAGVRVSVENWNLETYLWHWRETVVKPIGRRRPTRATR